MLVWVQDASHVSTLAVVVSLSGMCACIIAAPARADWGGGWICGGHGLVQEIHYGPHPPRGLEGRQDAPLAPGPARVPRLLTPCLSTQGTDARSSGHYTYTKASDFAGPPLTCTNRARVLSWLGQLGIHNQVQEGACILPSLSPAALMRLAEGARTVGCAWVDVR